MSDNRLKIGITQGDTNGIGWEVILKTLADSRIAELCTPVVYGSPAAAGYYRRCMLCFWYWYVLCAHFSTASLSSLESEVRFSVLMIITSGRHHASFLVTK